MGRRKRLHWIGLLIFLFLFNSGEILFSQTGDTASARSYQPRFRWTGSVSPVYTGTRGEVYLELTDWNPALEPPSAFYQGRIPANAIIEEGAPAAVSEPAGSAGVYRYAISIIALEGDSVNLASVSFNSSVYNLTIPALRIPVLPSPAVGIAEDTETFDDGKPDNANRKINFPENREDVFFLFQGLYDGIVFEIQKLWDEGRRAEALAEIRRRERDSPAGPFLASLRSEMEQALGLGFTESERWRPFYVHPITWLISFLLLFITGIFLLVSHPRWKKNRQPVTSGLPMGFKSTLILLLAASLTFILVEGGLRRLRVIPLYPARNAVVLEQVSAHRIPDRNSGINGWFSGGQPVLAGDARGGWRYVESADGRAGWISDEAVIIY